MRKPWGRNWSFQSANNDLQLSVLCHEKHLLFVCSKWIFKIHRVHGWRSKHNIFYFESHLPCPQPHIEDTLFSTRIHSELWLKFRYVAQGWSEPSRSSEGVLLILIHWGNNRVQKQNCISLPEIVCKCFYFDADCLTMLHNALTLVKKLLIICLFILKYMSDTGYWSTGVI